MNHLYRSAASSVVLALVLGAPAAFAEEAREGRQAHPSEAQGSAQAGGTMRTVEAGELDDADVVDRNGNEIGEIDELVRGEDGTTYAVISVGGFLDIGDKEIAMPLDRLSMHGGAMLLPKEIETLEQLEAQEEFDEDRYTEIEEDERVEVNRLAMTAGKGGSGEPRKLAAEDISGADVVDRKGNEIGRIDEIVRGEDGKTYAVISVGGFLDIGDRDVALALDRLSTWGTSVVLPDDVSTVEQLKGLGDYDADRYTRVADEDRVQIERSEFAAMETGMDSGMDSGADEDGQRMTGQDEMRED